MKWPTLKKGKEVRKDLETDRLVKMGLYIMTHWSILLKKMANQEMNYGNETKKEENVGIV